MNQISFGKRISGWVASVACGLLLAACGGGGGSAGSTGGAGGTGGTGGTPGAPTVSVSFVNASGAATNEVSSTAPLTVLAKVTDSSSKAVANALVTFSTDSSLAVMTPASGTALTDDTGTARVTLAPASLSADGAAAINAAVTVNGVAAKGSANFKVIPAAATAGAHIAVNLVDGNGNTSNSLSGATPLTGRAVVTDNAGKSVAGALVTFTADPGLVILSPSSGTTLTDASGVATVSLRPATTSASGAGTLTATSPVGGATVSGSINYQVNATTIALGTLNLSQAHIAAYGSTTVSIDVLANGAKYTEQQLNVQFSSACVTSGKATLAATAPTVNGTASAVYRDLGCGNNDTISAAVTGSSATRSATLQIDQPAAASVQFVQAAPTDRSIVIAGQGGLGRTETATLTFKVVDTFGNPLAGQVVTFSTTSSAVKLNKLSDTTDANGQVVTTVNSGSVATTFRVQAKLAGGASTLSDSIVVTTGLPVQRAMSLSLSTANVEGWSYDSGTTVPASTVNVLLADQFGNPVPDGTPVVFQTNMGAVGSSSKGACNTVNGGCSVDFRTQNPRVPLPGTPATPCNSSSSGLTDSTRPGVATICASTSDGSNTLYSKIAMFFSGSFATKVYMDGGSTPLTGGVVDLGSASSSASKVFTLQVNDLNNNPMPYNTSLTVSDVVKGNGVGVSPPTVANIFPHTTSGDDPTGGSVTAASAPQGSTHVVSIGAPAATDGTCVPVTTSFNVNITTPRGNTTTYPFKVQFTCP